MTPRLRWIIVGAMTALMLGWFGWNMVARDWLESRPIPCNELPTEQRVREVVAAHPDMVRRIEAAGRYVELGVWTAEGRGCAGRAYILIYYDTESTRDRIRKLIGRDFFGIPYRMANV